MTIFGWDASDFDYERGCRPSHIAAAAKEGISFFTHKATERSPGGLIVHEHFPTQLAAARDAGIPYLGCYVVPRTGVSAANHASSAVTEVQKRAPWLLDGSVNFFWQVDTEKWGYDNVSPALGEAVAVELERLTGFKAVHYAPKWAYGDTIPNPARPLWASSYGSNTSGPFKTVYAARGGDSSSGWVSYSGRTPKILQFGSNCVIGGQRGCDGNAFKGSVADFGAMIGGNDVALTTEDIDKIAKRVWDIDYVPVTPDDTSNPTWQAKNALAQAARVKPPTVEEITAAVVAALPQPTPTSGLTEAQIEAIVRKVVAKLSLNLAP